VISWLPLSYPYILKVLHLALSLHWDEAHEPLETSYRTPHLYHVILTRVLPYNTLCFGHVCLYSLSNLVWFLDSERHNVFKEWMGMLVRAECPGPLSSFHCSGPHRDFFSFCVLVIWVHRVGIRWWILSLGILNPLPLPWLWKSWDPQWFLSRMFSF
jgi:hypothetical protein